MNPKDYLPIETERLTLRIPEPEEAPKMGAYRRQNRQHLDPWEPLRPPTFYEDHYWNIDIKTMHVEFHHGESLRLSLFPKDEENPPIIGVCNYTQVMRGAFQACFLGYSMDHRYQGRGLMSEALSASLDFIFKVYRLNRVMANYMPKNERSGRLLKQLGFNVEGYARDYLRIAGHWEDHIMTSKLNPGF